MTPHTSRDEIPPGTLDMLILTTVAREGVLHGFEIASAIERQSANILQVEEGSLYPALQRLLMKGWIDGTWGRTPENRRARYYKITPSGRKQLAHEVASYQRVARAIGLVLRPS
jgi:PadR family transcriptional regulator PadR